MKPRAEPSVGGRTWVRFSGLKEALGGHCWSRPHLIRKCREGTFPLPYELSPNVVAWDLDELREWQASRAPVMPQGRNSGGKGGRPLQAKAAPAKHRHRVLLEEEDEIV